MKDRKKKNKASLRYLTGWALLLKRAVIEKIGLIPINFGKGYWEDTLYSRIATDNDLRLGVSSIFAEGQIVHYEHKTFGKTAQNLYKRYKNGQNIYRRIICGKEQAILPTIEDYTDPQKYAKIIAREQ